MNPFAGWQILVILHSKDGRIGSVMVFATSIIFRANVRRASGNCAGKENQEELNGSLRDGVASFRVLVSRVGTPHSSCCCFFWGGGGLSPILTSENAGVPLAAGAAAAAAGPSPGTLSSLPGASGRDTNNKHSQYIIMCVMSWIHSDHSVHAGTYTRKYKKREMHLHNLYT